MDDIYFKYMSIDKKQFGFTLMEIIIVVVILGILAAIAIPRLLGPNERVRASEGKQILTVLLGAQNRYALENNGAFLQDSVAITGLDVVIPASQNFNPPIGANANGLASITSSVLAYTLSIGANGVITCAEVVPGGSACVQACGGAQCN